MLFPEGGHRVIRVQGRQERCQERCDDVGDGRTRSGDVDVLETAGSQGRCRVRRCIDPTRQIARDGDELPTGCGQDQTSAGSGEKRDPEVALEQPQLA